MQKIEYDLPVFKDGDIADLNEYSEQMAEAIKVQIDKFGNPIIFKGAVETLDKLEELLEVKNGYVYAVTSENKNYIYNGSEWVEYSDIYDISVLVTKSELQESINNKVDKVTGKDLSTNDFTDTYKTKLDGIATGATNNTVIDSLESQSSTDALSANQGRILNEKITNATTYSTEEINTGEKWVDGKDIYRKVIYIGILPDDAKEKYAHNILNMDYLVQLNVTWYDTVDGKFWSLNRYDNAEAYIKFSCDKTNVQCETVYTWSDRTKDCYVIVEYTKTTD